MQNKRKLVLLSLLALCSSCASLTKSQLGEVNQFGQAIKAFSAYPAKIITTLVDVHTQNQYLLVGPIAEADSHKAHVDTIYKWIQTSKKNDEEIALEFQIINDYGQNLIHLTADAHTVQLDTAAQSFGTNMDSLLYKFNSFNPQYKIPTGYGILLGQLVSFGGDIYLRDRQAKGARAFVTKADTLVGMITLKLEEYLKSERINSIKESIIRERKDLARNYRNYLASENELIKINIKVDTVYRKDKHRKRDSVAKKDTVITGSLQAWRSSGIAVDRLYIKLLTNLDADETLRQQCLVAVEDLRKAHHKLMQGLKRKKKQREVFQEQLDFGIALTKMYSTIQQIK